MAESKEKYKFLFMGVLLAVTIILTYYFHFILRTGIVFTHLFYIPIIISALWWKRKGLSVTIFLVVMLILSSRFANNEITADDVLRAVMFIVIAVVVVILSEGISKREEALQKARDELEIRVKERTAEIAESASRFRTLLENVPAVILHLSPERRILDCNPEAEKLYMWKKEEVLGKDYIVFIPEEAREAVAAEIKKVLAGKSTKGFVNPVKLKDGSERILMWNAECMLDAEGKPSGIIATGEDITERLRTEDALRESEKFSRTVINTIDDVIMVVDVRDFSIVSFNNVFLKTYGLKEKEVIGKKCYEITHNIPDRATLEMNSALSLNL